MDEIYENCAIVPIIPIAYIIPTISIMEAYRHKKKRVLTRSDLCIGAFLRLAVRGRPDGAARGCFSWICTC